MNNKQLEYAIALSKSLNFSHVAEQFKISQPALSKQILNLEKKLGVVLFDRKQNPIALTAAGEVFFKEARNLLYREEQLYRSMEEFNIGKKGRLSIGISPFRALYLLPEICKCVKDKYPGIKIVLHEDYSDNLRRNVTEGKYDFAIANLPVDESVLDVIPIEQDKLVLVIPKCLVHLLSDYPEKQFSHINFNSCQKLPFIVVSQNQEMRQLFEKLCSFSNFEPDIAMEVTGLATTWQMSKIGIGATILPLQFVQNMGLSDDVLIFFPEHSTNVRQPAIITKRGQFLPEYVKFAIDLLINKHNSDK